MKNYLSKLLRSKRHHEIGYNPTTKNSWESFGIFFIPVVISLQATSYTFGVCPDLQNAQRKAVTNLCEICSAASQSFDYVELFAGRGWVADAMSASGRAVAKLDILYGQPEPNKENNMDLTSSSGFL